MNRAELLNEIFLLPEEDLSQRWNLFLSRTCPNYQNRIDVRIATMVSINTPSYQPSC